MKSKNKSALAALPATDNAIAHHREVVRTEQETLHGEVCRLVTENRCEWGANLKNNLKAVNNGREIGLLFIKWAEEFPGRRWTRDLWEQNRSKLIDHNGFVITFENIAIYIRHAEREPELITDVVHALSFQRDFFPLIGLEVSGQAPGREPVPQNHFSQATIELPNFARKLENHVKELESDTEHYGPLDRWKPAEAGLMLEKVRPAFDLLNSMVTKLQIAATKTIDANPD